MRGAEIFFIEEAIPRSIRQRRITKLPITGELASALRTLHISTFNDLIGLSLRDLQRVSDKSSGLFLELSRLIKLAAAGKAASVSNRGTRGDRLRKGQTSSVPRRTVGDTKDIKLTALAEALIRRKGSSAVERTTNARARGASDEQTGLPRARPSPVLPPAWPVTRQRDIWLANRIFIPISERGRPLQTLAVSVRLSHVFEYAKLKLLGDLHGKSYLEISGYRNCGRKTLEELSNLVRQIQLGNSQHRTGDKRVDRISEENVKNLLKMSVNEIGLSVRAANCFNNANITTVGQLAQKTEAEMLNYGNFGKKSLNEIKEKLAQLGLSLGIQEPNILLSARLHGACC